MDVLAARRQRPQSRLPQRGTSGTLDGYQCACDIAYSGSPTASRASPRVGKNSIRTTLASWIVQTWA